MSTRIVNALIDRRTALLLGMASGAVAGLAATGVSSLAATLLRKTIPSSGEKIPVIGVGTNNYSPTTPEERAARRAVLERLTAAGLSVIDTAPLIANPSA